jgi:hypothetical protein
MRAILIDPSATPAISEIDVEPTLEKFQELVGGYIEAYPIQRDTLFVNEEWNMQKSPKFSGRFQIGNFTFGGRGVIVGKGGEADALLPLLKASQLVTIIHK